MDRHDRTPASESPTSMLVPPDDWASDFLGEKQYRALKLAGLLTEFAHHGLPEPRKRECVYLFNAVFGAAQDWDW